MVDLYRQVYYSNNFPNRHNCLSSTKSWTVTKIHKKKELFLKQHYTASSLFVFLIFLLHNYYISAPAKDLMKKDRLLTV